MRSFEAPAGPLHRMHLPRVHRLRDALERVRTQIAQLECSAHQAPRGRRNDDLIGTGQPLQAGRQVGRLA